MSARPMVVRVVMPVVMPVFWRIMLVMFMGMTGHIPLSGKNTVRVKLLIRP